MVLQESISLATGQVEKAPLGDKTANIVDNSHCMRQCTCYPQCCVRMILAIAMVMRTMVSRGRHIHQNQSQIPPPYHLQPPSLICPAVASLWLIIAVP